MWAPRSGELLCQLVVGESCAYSPDRPCRCAQLAAGDALFHPARFLIWIDPARTHDAFLSYSWKSDGKIEPIIQSLLQRFVCPLCNKRAALSLLQVRMRIYFGVGHRCAVSRCQSARSWLRLANPFFARSSDGNRLSTDPYDCRARLY